MLAPGKSMQADLHSPRLPYVLIIYSLPVVFVCNALFLFLLLAYFQHRAGLPDLQFIFNAVDQQASPHDHR